ncbi:MAG: nitroreductase family protein, partial [Oscillospiraceae bacterium]
MLYDLLTSRRSRRIYDAKPIVKEKIEVLKKSALIIPTSKNRQTVELVFTENKILLSKLAEAKNRGGDFIKNSALAITIMSDSLVDDVWVEDAAVAGAQLMLVAEDLGLSCCWCQIRRRFNDDEGNMMANDIVKRILGIPQKYEVLSILAIGNRSEENEEFATRIPNPQKIHI